MSAGERVAPVCVQGLKTVLGERVIHEYLDLEVRAGEILGLVGASGSGKSVLLDTLLGLRSPAAGTVRILGHELFRASDAELRDVKSRWGVLFQSAALFSNLTVRENVAAALLEHTTLPSRVADELADLKIASAGLPPDAAPLRPGELSGGMRKRAGLARAIALDPELLFLDEPASGLDPIVAAQFDRLMQTLTRSIGGTVLLVTHDLDSLYTICDRVAVLADKRVIATAPIHELEEMDHPLAEVRMRAINALKQRRPPEAIASLLRTAFAYPHDPIQGMAVANALGRFAEAEAREALARIAREHEGLLVRRAAAEAFALRGCDGS